MKERPKEIMTITLIGINILVFIVLTMIGRTEDGYFMLQHGAMYEPYIIENQEYYRLFTSLFLHFGTLVDEGLDVAFGKHAAAAGDGVGAGRALGGLVHLVGTHLQQGSHLVNERAGAAGTAAVHADLGAVGQEQDFCVLAAQLNDAVGAGGQAVGCHAGGENLLHKGHLTAVGQAHAGRAGDGQIDPAGSLRRSRPPPPPNTAPG